MTFPDLWISSKRKPIAVYHQDSLFNINKIGDDIDVANDDFPTGEWGELGARPNPRVVEAFGKQFFLHLNTIRERNEGGTDKWGPVFTFPPGSTTPAGWVAWWSSTVGRGARWCSRASRP